MPISRWRKTKTPDAAALLANANSASQHLAVLHIAFMAVCAYVLIVVFGTTDLDLLIGKGVRLPVVNVEVPIVGFYAFAPYFVVLVHLNLLLQLQLLSRKLFTFDAAADGLHDQLHIFPYTFYLVGRTGPVVRALVGLLVSITLIFLPLATLLALQLEFLAYQSEAVTWWQRLATWLDVALLVALWPVILHRSDDWRGYWRELIAAHIPRRRLWFVFPFLLLGQVMLLFGTSFTVTVAGLGLLVCSPLFLILLYGRKAWSRSHVLRLLLLVMAAVTAVVGGIWVDSAILFLIGPAILIPLAMFWRPTAPRGGLALLFALYIGLLAPLSLLVIGETFEYAVLGIRFPENDLATPPRKWVDNFKNAGKSDTATTLFKRRFSWRSKKLSKDLSPRTTFISWFWYEKRRLTIENQVVLAKPPTPEALALIRAGKWREALTQIEPINLETRSLQDAFLMSAILVGANLADAQLQGAYLWSAKLQGADLAGAQLQGAYLESAQLQGANLAGAKLQGANLVEAQLQGAHLDSIQLQGANLASAGLQGAYLRRAKLQGANLIFTQLQVRDLEHAELHGAVLYGATLYSDSLDVQDTTLIDVRNAVWAPLPSETLATLTTRLHSVVRNLLLRKEIESRLAVLSAASNPRSAKPRLSSCFAEADTPFVCKKRFDPTDARQTREFTRQLHAYLVHLACEAPDIASGILSQSLWSSYPPGGIHEGLQTLLKKRLDDPACFGLYGLSAEEKNKLRAMP